MANFWSQEYRNNVLGGGTFANVQLDADTIKAMFIDEGTDTVAVSDTNIAAITSGARVPAIASCPTLASKTIGTVGAGVFDAADTLFTSLTGSSVEALILFKDTGTEATSILICHWNTNVTGLPLTPNGSNVTIVFAANGVLSV